MKPQNYLDFSIADIGIRMVMDKPVIMEDAFRPFQVSEPEPQYTAEYRCVERFPEVPRQVLHESNCFRVHPDGKGGYLRSFFDAPRDFRPYALATYDYPKGNILVEYLEKGKNCLSETSNCMFHLGLEAMMLEKQRLILHAACVRTPLGGILFSGSSGVGKSTQAELWRRYRGGEIINGDRTILSCEGDNCLAWGSPYAGSSRYFVNDCVEVSCIVMLRQEASNRIRRMGLNEAFRKVYAGLTVYSWDRHFTERACDLAIDLVRKVPVLEFGCTADASAVEYLEKYCVGELGL